MSLILASTSPTRRQLLASAGLTFEIVPPAVDEEAARDAFVSAGGALADLAAHLAGLKALDVSQRHGSALVIGADQTLVADGCVFNKPADRAGVIQTLQRLNGRSHSLYSAVTVARGCSQLWTETVQARLTMRGLDDAEIERYAERAGTRVYGSVGGYQIEGLGMILFEAIEGEHTTILGLPMLPLLRALRRFGGLAW